MRWVAPVLPALWLLAPECDGLHAAGAGRKPGAEVAKVATIIAMDMRLSKEEKQRAKEIRILNMVTKDTDVFLCTDRESQGEVRHFRNVRKTQFAEEAIFPRGLYGGNTIQWWRLQECWGIVRQHEIERGLNYTFIAKLRTDCFRWGCVPINRFAYRTFATYGASLDKYVFIQSDVAFGGSHAVMERVTSLYSRIPTHYWHKDTEYVPLDFDLIAKSDFRAGRFRWLNWPQEPFGDPPCTLSKGCIKRAFRALKAWERRHNKTGDEVKSFTMKGWLNEGISSEKVFVLDLLAAGFTIKAWEHHGVSHAKADRDDTADDTIDGDIGKINYTFDFSKFNSTAY